MTHAWTFETAAAFWERTKQDPETPWEDFDAAERFILDHEMQSTAEAAQVVSVLIQQGGDGRSDGRDVTALTRLRAWLSNLG